MFVQEDGDNKWDGGQSVLGNEVMALDTYKERVILVGRKEDKPGWCSAMKQYNPREISVLESNLLEA